MEKIKSFLPTLGSILGWGILAGIVIYVLWLGLAMLTGEQMIIGASVILTLVIALIFCLCLKYHWLFSVYGFGIVGLCWLTGSLFGLDYLGSMGLPENLTAMYGHICLYPILGMLYWIGLFVILTPMIVMAVSGPKEKWIYGGCVFSCLIVVLATIYTANLIFPVM